MGSAACSSGTFPPVAGYRVRLANGRMSGALTVHSTRSPPWNPNVYNQSIPDNGYTYLTTRDGTKLAIYVYPPTSRADGLPPGGDPPARPAPSVPRR